MSSSTLEIDHSRDYWPSIPLLNPYWDDKPEGISFYRTRHNIITLALSDPFRNGFEPNIWKVADQQRAELRELFPKGIIHEVNLGGNRSSKSERAAKRVVEACMKKPGSRWWCADATERSSRGNQQRLIEKYLPREWKPDNQGKLGKGRQKVQKVTYSVATGFADNTLVLPNGSEIEFKFYEQKTGSLQAVELDGFWGDELLPLDWIETIEYRLVNRNGVFHLTFTPVEGYTQTVAYYLDDAQVKEEVPAPLLPLFDNEGNLSGLESVPRILQCKRPNARVIYFHTEDNPFGNYPGMVEQVRHKSKEEIGMRVYGVVDKAAHVQFPLFKENVHVINEQRWKEILRSNPKGTRYHIVDPCSGRNWFMLWVYCPYPDKWIIYREWPSHGHPKAYVEGIGDPGEWAVSGEAHDGDRGPAQQPFNLGLIRYRDEILRVEEGEEIFERWMDSRYGNSAKTDREGSTTLIEQMQEIDMEFIAAAAEQKISLDVADGSLDMIATRLYYDPETPLGSFSEKLAKLNEPELLVHENCPNLIWSFRNWTGKDRAQGACKDPIDCVRYLFLSELNYVDSEHMTPISDWHRQFA